MLSKLRQVLKQSLKEKNREKKDIVQAVISASDEKRIELKRELTDEEFLRVIDKEIKKYNQALDGAKKANRDDLVGENLIKIDLLQSLKDYLTS